MNKESEGTSVTQLLSHPLLLIGVGVAALGLLLFFGWHTIQPAQYQPSPGVGGRPKVDIPYMKPGATPPPRQ